MCGHGRHLLWALSHACHTPCGPVRPRRRQEAASAEAARPRPCRAHSSRAPPSQVSNRKGKRILAFELNVKCKWEGQVDYDDVSGELLMPYISEDVDDAKDYEVKLTAKEPSDASHKKALKFLTAQIPTIREGLKAFKEEIQQK